MQRLPAIDPATATGEAKTLLESVQQKLGMTPNIIRSMANSPAAVKAYFGFGDALSTGRLDAKSREAIALTVAASSGCEYCASAHTAISKNLKVEDDEIAERLQGRSSDPVLNATLVFAKRIVETRGWVTDDDLAAVRAAGHDDETIAEIVANVAANLFTNYFNHVARTEIDFPKVELATAKAA